MIVVVEHRIHVLTLADVAGAVVSVPELLQEILVADCGGIEVDGDGFGVVAERAVGRALFRASAIADPGPKHTLENPRLGVGGPKSSEAEGGRLEGKPGG